MDIRLGIDIGSVALKLVALNQKGRLVFQCYRRHFGQPADSLKQALAEFSRNFSSEDVKSVTSTGSGGNIARMLIGGDYLNEIVALAKAAEILTPGTATLIEMGGADSKLLCFGGSNGHLVLSDFAMNSLCAAGTGSFLDQQASRLNISIEDEFGELALKSKFPPRIAGRCSVFAKSDMIHLQQIATPDYDIVAGLCYAVARNFKSSIARGKKIAAPVAFVGGVASNLGMVKAFQDVLGLKPGEFIVPTEHQLFCAYGAACHAMESLSPSAFNLQAAESAAMPHPAHALNTREKLVFGFPDQKHYRTTLTLKRRPEVAIVEGYLGVDVGSLSTNLVVLDCEGNVLARRYLMTAGRPIEAVRQGLAEIGAELDGKVRIVGCGTTGSGRYLTGDFIGADLVRNEITAQARAAVMFDKNVDTIFEIGGQDSKYIALENGVVVDFEMNKACAAGTGSFLQEQAEKLNIKIEEEFGDRALCAGCPVGCGERCTVFMESDLLFYQQAGIDKDNLVAGLAYSIASNYLTRVVQKRRIGRRIFFQGGVAWNRGVVAAFEKILGQPIIVPPHHDITGAIGIALLAMERPRPHESRFRGFDLSRRKYTVESFVCEDCSNCCEIKKVAVEGEQPLFYGSRCEKYDAEAAFREDRFDFYRFREKVLYSSIAKKNPKATGKTIGFPRVLFFHELYPFWASFFRSLGYNVVLSAPTNRRILEYGLENCPAETCFPVKVVSGHIHDLLAKKVHYIFLPSIINVRDNGDEPHENSFLCPYVQSIPYTILANFDFGAGSPEILTVPLSMKMDQASLLRELSLLKERLRIADEDLPMAIAYGLEKQSDFINALREQGRRFLRERDPLRPAVCIISRPYNGCDARLSLEIPQKLMKLGVDVISMEALPLEEEYGSLTGANMYWRFGQKILAAAEVIRTIPNLYPVYISNFGCGPDSFIIHFFAERLAGRPFLQIEIDEHSADTGIITRLEAFLDSLASKKEGPKPAVPFPRIAFSKNGIGRTIFIPYMSDHALTFAAAFRSCGIPAEALPESTSTALEYGKRFTSGKECFPCQVTTGDILLKIHSPGFDRNHSAFFMPSASGPCRFGQYHLFHRQILDELGYADVPIISPNSRTGYADLCASSGELQKQAWKSMVATDLLFKLYHHFRPYQDDKTAIDQLYQHYLMKLADDIEARREIEPLLISALADFKSCSRPIQGRLPIVGVVGEIFLRANRFSNNRLVERLEELGAEVWLAPMAEWVFYTNFTYRRRLRSERRLGELLTAALTNRFQHRLERGLSEYLAAEFSAFCDPPIEELIRLAAPYLHVSFSGEAILSIGKAIEYYHKGVGGIVNTLPFMCMPGTIVSAISRRISQDLNGLPWLNLSYEGLSDKGEELRLEAFMHQVRQFPARS